MLNMEHFIQWLNTLILSYPSYAYFFVFLGTILGGELALFFIGFIVAQHILPFFPTLLISFLGALIPNILWFYLGQTKIVEKTTSKRHANTTFQVVTDAVYRVSRGSHLVALIIIKFLVGTPVLLVMYTHKTSLAFKKFLYYQSIAVLLSMLALVFLGYISGRGFSYLTEVSQNLYSAIGFLLLVVFIFALFQAWFEKRFAKE